MNYLTEVLDKKNKQHNIDSFTCGSKPLDIWLKTQANQSAKKGHSHSYVIADDANIVIGYYAIVVRKFFPQESLPESFDKKFPNGTTGALLARLAVDSTMQGKGIGAALLYDALQRIKNSAAETGALLLFVDAKEGKEDFYLKYGFTPLSSDPSTMFIRIDEIP
jgi:GNAT superfamily N-acetyltransferase